MVLKSLEMEFFCHIFISKIDNAFSVSISMSKCE